MLKDCKDSFSDRHIGPRKKDQLDMIKTLGLSSQEELTQKALPQNIQLEKKMDLPKSLSENDFLNYARSVAKKNKVFRQLIGLGYYECITPKVIQRNILENPGWYTAYTPYQSEISQGRLEALLNFQTLIIELTGMDLANASLLDEGTAAAEAASMAFNLQKKRSKILIVDENIFKQTREVLLTRMQPLGIEVLFTDVLTFDFSQTKSFATLVQYPNKTGSVEDFTHISQHIRNSGSLLIAGADLMALCLLSPPGEWGADIVYGSTQRFGVPLGFGGPHAAYIATKNDYKRSLPGRIVGVSKDSAHRPALRLALQTREQHIRREKAKSNICTSQVLLAVMASMYAVYHGPEGLQKIAQQIHSLTSLLASGLQKMGYQLKNTSFFDTLCLQLPQEKIKKIRELSESQKFNFNYLNNDGSIQLSLDEKTDLNEIKKLLTIFNLGESLDFDINQLTYSNSFKKQLLRKSKFLTQPTFNKYHSETEMLRYIHKLEEKDLCLNKAMIPLGSCTMKLNATTEMIPITWPEFSDLHPFCPQEQAAGYAHLIEELEDWLCEITGFEAISFQPNAGSQGEYAGLLIINKYNQAKGHEQRNICLIPSSAHGTNPASAVMAGLKVVVVDCDNEGNIQVDDLVQKAEFYKDTLSCLMATYPSTHGVFEESFIEICEVIHKNGGQVYMDGANLNALVGLSQPGKIGPDVMHLNLHKTFCIPHGGGGPGVGPIAVAKHLTQFLPTHCFSQCGPKTGIKALSSSAWGSAGILPISWAYLLMMGGDGLTKATRTAILNANYIAKRLQPHYPILYQGPGGWVAHECIIDTRAFKNSAQITVDDIAKRLIDFGFHAPTMSWPVAGTLMIEPTESESKEEIDRFCEAMIKIKKEIIEIEDKKVSVENNLLKNAPHSIYTLTKTDWPYPYSRESAGFPLPWVKEHKFWPPVDRVDNVHGDKNLICSCPSLENYKNNEPALSKTTDAKLRL